MAVTTTGSSNIAILDTRVIADLCAGKFYIDVTPSTYIADGVSNVLGANVQISDPNTGVIFKNYGSNYEIAPALSGGMDGVVSFNIPTVANNFKYGKYRIDVQLFDGLLSWIDTKYVTICEPDPNNKTKSFGSLSAIIKGVCKDGYLNIVVDNVPNYRGVQSESQVNSFTLEYPTSSGLPVLTTSVSAFSVQLYEGVYKITGEICATYNFGDNVYVKVKYKIKKEKNVRCLIDECCVFERLSELDKQLRTNCTLDEKMRTTETIFDALRLLKTIQLAGDCGEDASDFINDLEKLLDCKCNCNCAEGTPIINNTPSRNISIEGCGVTKQTVGLTDVYTINNYDYVVDIAENGGVITVSDPQIDGCTTTFPITFNISRAYAQIRTLANAADTEGDFWASVVNKGVANIDPACLGISVSTWNALTLKQKFQAVVTKVCNCCGCDGAISNVAVTHSGADVTLTFDVNDSVFYVDVYLDGVFKGRLLTTTSREDIPFTFLGAADGVEHEYTLIPVCANNAPGSLVTDQFAYLGCPDVAPPELTATSVTDAACPYDLTGLEQTPPAGITYEWHSADDTSAATLITGTSASSGIYYVFARNADGCYSMGVRVTLICSTAGSCSAPQNLSVTKFGSGIALIQFQSAAYPPPSSSYTVKRKAFADPDVDGSYTTIGTPIWNATAQRWQITDNTLSSNTLYTYKAQSNCGDSPPSTPSILATYADILCNAIEATPDTNSIDYSLATTGYNEITKYEVKLYDQSGTILLHTDTFTAPFADPITGTFTYLTAGTVYKIIVTAYIGTYSKTSCTSLTVTTLTAGTENFQLHAANNFSIDSVTGTGVPTLPSTGVNGSQAGHHTGTSGALSVTISGTLVTPSKLTVYVDFNPVGCQDISGAGVYSLSPGTTLEGQIITISIEIGACS